MYPARLKIMFGLVLASFVLLVVRLGYLQIFEGAKYRGISEKRLLRDYSIPARRGGIYDRYGRPLAVEEPAFDITVRYRNLLYGHVQSGGEMPPALSQLKAHSGLSAGCGSCHDDMGLWVTRLPGLLDLTPRQLLDRAGRIVNRVERIKRQVQRRHRKAVRVQEEFASHAVARDVPLEKAAEFEMNQDFYPGVSMDARPKRYYPYRDAASHILGYLGKLTPDEIQKARSALRQDGGGDERLLDYYRSISTSEDHRVGRAGIEGFYNLELTGIPGKRVEEISIKTRKVNKVIFDMPPRHGNDIFLTIDLDVQRLAEEVLGERKGSIVVMDTHSGEVIAMAGYPRYNPNTFSRDYGRLIKDPGKPLLNRPVQAMLPCGSTFKIVTALTALTEGKIDAATSFYCSGSVTAGRRKFRCTYSHGYLDLRRAIEKSCNVYFFETAKRLNGRAMREWAQRLGLGYKTGIDLPYEASGNIPLPRYTGERLNMSIGQGNLLVTPIQMTQMVSAVANDGVLVKPRLLKKIVADDGRILREAGAPETRVVDVPEEYFHVVKEALRQVVISGTARHRGLEELGVAGKTGTAQIGGSDENHVWFVGYFPFDDPRYAFCITIEHTTGHGGSVAGPIARGLVSGMLEMERSRKQLTAKRDDEFQRY